MKQDINVTKQEIDKRVNDDFNSSKFKISPIAYLYMFINVLCVLGATISLILFFKQPENDFIKYFPIITNLISLIILLVFLYFETKVIIPKKFHVNPKWYKFFMASVASFGLMTIFSILFIYLANLNKLIIILHLAILMAWSLINIGLYWYARFHIDQDIYRRQHGIDVKNTLLFEKKRKIDRDQVDKLSNQEFSSLKKKLDNNTKDLIGKKPTSGLLDEAKN